MTDGLLLLHAWPLDAREWEPQRAALPDGLRVAAPNHPGFGGTPSAGDVMTMEACASNAVAAMDDAGIVLANTRAVADTPEAAAGRRDTAERLRREGNLLATEPPALLAADAPTELQEHVRALIADQSAEAIAAAQLGMAARPDSTPDLATIDVPTLVITSSGDRLINPEVSVAMGQQIPSVRVEVIEGVGHLTNLEAPEAFNRLLLDHLAACGLP
jgi:pimeloyl-ACP methyl ester carboxylesterase